MTNNCDTQLLVIFLIYNLITYNNNCLTKNYKNDKINTDNTNYEEERVIMAEKFKRKEIKYLITNKQYNQLKQIMINYVVPDQYFKSIIKNIYYDTDHFLLVRRSNDKPIYKEKLRIRSYGIKSKEENVFVELKRKYDGVVYKRRIEMKYQEALLFLAGEATGDGSQIAKELQYFINYYQTLAPKIMLTYQRLSFKGIDSNLRITFDYDILWRDYDLDLTKECYGTKILDDDLMIMEIKTEYGYPLWLVDFLSSNKIYKTSFSKYGNAYKNLMIKGEEQNVY